MQPALASLALEIYSMVAITQSAAPPWRPFDFYSKPKNPMVNFYVSVWGTPNMQTQRGYPKRLWVGGPAIERLFGFADFGAIAICWALCIGSTAMQRVLLHCRCWGKRNVPLLLHWGSSNAKGFIALQLLGQRQREMCIGLGVLQCNSIIGLHCIAAPAKQ